MYVAGNSSSATIDQTVSSVFLQFDYLRWAYVGLFWVATPLTDLLSVAMAEMTSVTLGDDRGEEINCIASRKKREAIGMDAMKELIDCSIGSFIDLCY